MILDRCTRLSKDRLDRLKKGIDLLEEWIHQLLQQGLEVLRKDIHRIDDMATRAVDYGMPSIARRLRLIPTKIAEETEWIEFLSVELGQLLFLIDSIKNPNTQLHPEDVLSTLGVSIKKQEVIDHTQSIEDEWLYIGSIHDKEENIRIHRHWFYGIHFHKYALFLDFEVNRFTKIREFHLGKLYVGAVHYYPSAMPLRVVSIPTADRSMPSQIEFKKHSIKSYQESYAKAFSAHPFIRQTPVCLSEIKIIKEQEIWFLSDSEGFGMLSAAEESQNYKMMGYCMDPHIILLGEFSEKQFNPMSVFSQGYIKKI
ncbi:MAG: hypothetical protein IPH93_13495 [Saprospiraceae bacterium]|nr:hypothetical protein [Saprospiraceae bacterium]MBK7810874.1 hypothetical protein [Saprospiraceae bacterium]MBK9630475.1 hypothetical protein [Saprospiraceae bacterium]